MIKKFLKNTIQLIKENRRALFYSISVTVGIYIALDELHNRNNATNFYVFSIALLGIFVIEVFSNWQYQKDLDQLDLDVKDFTDNFKDLTLRIGLPIILYLSLVGFGKYNMTSEFLPVILLLTFVSFVLLFTNIRAYFENSKKTEKQTHYVLDILKFILFFTSVNFFSHSTNFDSTNLLVYSVLTGVMSFILIIMMLWRINKLRKQAIFFTFLAAVFISVIFFYFHSIGNLNPLRISLFLIFLFYILTALIHHKITDTLNRSIVTEYAMVLSLAFVITYGIV